MLERNAMRFTHRLGLNMSLDCVLNGFWSESGYELSGAPGEILSNDLTVGVDQDKAGGGGEPAPGVTVRFSVLDNCDAKVNGDAADWVVTDSLGQASVEVTIGNRDCTVMAEALPPAVYPSDCQMLHDPVFIDVLVVPEE